MWRGGGELSFEIHKMYSKDIRVCLRCFHGQGVRGAPYNYVDKAMSVPFSDERQSALINFIKYLNLNDRSVIEIGASSGELGSLLMKFFKFKLYDIIEPSGIKVNSIFNKVIVASLEDFAVSLPAKHNSGQNLKNIKNLTDYFNKYDLLVITHCLEHILNLEMASSAIKNLLTEDGLVYLEVPNRSGHPMFLLEENPSHEHYFSINSIVLWLQRNGFEIIKIISNGYHNERCPDTIHVLARESGGFKEIKTLFNVASFSPDDRDIIVWGAGEPSIYEIEKFIRKEAILFVIDSDTSKHGKQIAGFEVVSPDILLNFQNAVVYINSLAFDDEIKNQISKKYHKNVSRIVYFKDIIKLAEKQIVQ
jgi:hypothetical protein